MALEKAFDDALKALHTSGGVVTVILGTGVDAPTDWTYHPRVHWVNASQLKRHDIPGAIPTNTKLMFFTDNISGNVFQPLHDERKRRRLPYMIRKSGDAVGQGLKEIFPNKVIAAPTEKFSPMPSISEPDNGGSNGNGAAAPEPAPERGTTTVPGSKNTAAGKPRGFLQEFLRANVDLTSTTLSNAEEARRLFKKAQLAGVPTTLGSIEQGVRVMRRVKGLGSRPESVAPKHVSDTVAVTKALESCIELLTGIKDRVGNMDTTDDELRKENEDLRTRIGLMKDAFAGL